MILSGKKFMAALLSATAFAGTLYGKIITAPLICDYMVLQRDMKVPVWGKAEPGEKITVEFAGQKVETVTGKDGKFMAVLAPMKASAENRDMTISGKSEKVVLKNVLVGEVWLGGGQSNMEIQLKTCIRRFPEEERDMSYKNCANDMLRIAKVYPPDWSELPCDDFPVKWQVITPEIAWNMSATGYYFATELSKELKIPVGFIQSCRSGTYIEAWTSLEGFSMEPRLKKTYAKAKARQAAPPELPAGANRKENKYFHTPTVLYNRMIHPLAPYAMKGVIWYHGSNNLNNGPKYFQRLEALYAGWKKAFRNPELRFYLAQLAPFSCFDPNGTALPVFWETQERFAKAHAPFTGQAVLIDVGEIDDIHPKDKRPVAKRLAALALNRDYGRKDIPCDSPVFRKATAAGGKLILEFDAVKEFKAVGDPGKWFVVADASGIFYRVTEVKFDGNKIILASKFVKKPTQVRYGWLNAVTGNIFNEGGLPLGAFRYEPAE